MKFVLFFLLMSLGTVQIQGENNYFEVQGEKHRKVQVSANDKLEIAQIDILNISESRLELEWKTVKNTLNEKWNYSMCAYGKCQIGIPTSGNFKPIEKGKTGFIAIHIFPNGVPGEGGLEFEIIDKKSGVKETISYEVRFD